MPVAIIKGPDCASGVKTEPIDEDSFGYNSSRIKEEPELIIPWEDEHSLQSLESISTKYIKAEPSDEVATTDLKTTKSVKTELSDSDDAGCTAGNSEELYYCFHCKFFSEGLHPLKMHISLTHNRDKNKVKRKKRFFCPFCDFKTAYSMYLKTHKLLHTDNSPIDRKKPINPEARRFSCFQCLYRATQITHLKSHIRSKHTGEKPHRCAHCDYSAVQSAHLKYHVNSKHAAVKKRNYPCPHCDYRATESHHLWSHVRHKHTKEKPYVCSLCGHKSFQAHSLKSHMRIKHSEEKPLMCHFCDYKTSENAYLKYHIMTKHEGRKWRKCPHCSYKTLVEQNYNSHQKVKHVNK